MEELYMIWKNVLKINSEYILEKFSNDIFKCIFLIYF